MVKPTGRYAKVNPLKPEAMGICDRSGFLFNRKDLKKQMRWAGNSLVWTGLWVGEPFLDIPNQQGQSPELGPDPIPVAFPRPPVVSPIPWERQWLETWEFQGFPWKEDPLGSPRPSPEIHATLTGWGRTQQAVEALPNNDREAALQKTYFGTI